MLRTSNFLVRPLVEEARCNQCLERGIIRLRQGGRGGGGGGEHGTDYHSDEVPPKEEEVEKS